MLHIIGLIMYNWLFAVGHVVDSTVARDGDTLVSHSLIGFDVNVVTPTLTLILTLNRNPPI